MNKPLLYQCVVLDNQDPLLLGRVRARLLTDNYLDIISSITDPPWDETKDVWTARDPFIFNPLLPFFIYQVPKVEELIYILYYNNDFKYQNQFYVQAMFSSPTTSPFQYYIGAQKFTGVGIQYTNPLPIKNQDGTYKNNIPKGVFPNPGDNAILGRGSADMIVKEEGVLVRAGKIQGQFQPNVIPVGNNKGGFLQIERFYGQKSFDRNQKSIEVEEVVMMTQYLIEWNIVNPENLQNKFNGSVNLYKLKPNTSVNTSEINVNSQIENLKSIIYTRDFTDLSMEQTVLFINSFINECNSENRIEGKKIFTQGDKFPIYYRPSQYNYKILQKNPTTGSTITTINSSISNLTKISTQIRLNASAPAKGFGLIYDRNKVGLPFRFKQSKEKLFKYKNNPVIYASLGSDKIFLLSQKSAIPGAPPINFDDTLYGFSREKYEEILDKNQTSSSVRGEQLMELLNLIVRFLISHTHAYPGMAPVTVSYDGTTTQQILEEIQNAASKILNENIRLN